jgi:hypothetical protein
VVVSYMRQRGILPVDRVAELPVWVIGAGATGSAVTLALAKMGCRNIRVFDSDVVEPHNVPCQLYGPRDVGMSKVAALRDLAEQQTGVCIATCIDSYPNGDVPPGGSVVVVCVDSMDARRRIWTSLKRSPAELVIDTRMGALTAAVYAIPPRDRNLRQVYETEDLYPSSEAFRAPCTERGIVYGPFGVAAVVGSLVKRFVMGQTLPYEILVDLEAYWMVTNWRSGGDG